MYNSSSCVLLNSTSKVLIFILQRGEKMTKDEVQRIIDEVDEDKNGKLDYKEVN